MADDRNKFVFEGKLVEEIDGVGHTLINQDNVVAGSDIAVEKDGDNVKVNLDLGITLVDGVLCATFEEEEV